MIFQEGFPQTIGEALEQLEHLLDSAWQFMASPEGISVGAGLGVAALAGMLTNYFQQREANVFPVLFASKRELERENEGTDFYAAVNDLTMGVTELWNRSREQKNYRSFVQDMRNASSHSLVRLVSDVQRSGATLLASLHQYSSLEGDAGETSEAFDASWDYYYNDVYRTETYLDTETDSKGNTRTVMKTRQVYDHTDHEWTFQRGNAENAQRMLESLLERFRPEGLYDPELASLRVDQNFSDKEAIKKTILEDDEKDVTDEEAKGYANQWLEHARLSPLPQHVKGTLAELARTSPDAFETISASQDNYHETTYSQGPTTGPDGYEASRRLEGTCGNIADEISGVLSSINTSIGCANSLKEILDSTYNYQAKLNPKRMAHKALDYAVESYLAAFPDSGIDVDQRVQAGVTMGLALIAGLAAGVGTYFLLTNGG